MDGLLLVDKPKDWTSFDVVAKTRGIVRAATGIKKIKVGHTGTLDPKATGLLVLAIGSATKQIPELIQHDKIYEAEVTLGANSTTDDVEGDITPVSQQKPSLNELKDVLEQFIGEIQQVPPNFSAIKVDGKRAYASAREGKQVELKARTVKITSISDLRYDYPKFSFICDVGSGTYIRSLARDIGVRLGVGAYLSDLRRLTVGEFSVQDALTVDELNIESIQAHIKPLA